MDVTSVQIRNPSELIQQIEAHISELASLTDRARLSEGMVEYLNMCARFHTYSICNTWLILLQRPDATKVAGYNRWKEMGRYVLRGQHGIGILAPIFTLVINEEGLEERMLTGFRPAIVFDYAQTGGKALPAPPNWNSPEMDVVLHNRLMQLADSHGIKVKVQSLPKGVMGASLGGMILLSPFAGTGVFLHELGHELLHQRDDAPKERSMKELEAEGISFVVGRHFGLSGLTCPSYISLYGASAVQIRDHLDRIRNTAVAMINSIESDHIPFEEARVKENIN